MFKKINRPEQRQLVLIAAGQQLQSSTRLVAISVRKVNGSELLHKSAENGTIKS